jgi:hypothetical protein
MFSKNLINAIGKVYSLCPTSGLNHMLKPQRFYHRPHRVFPTQEQSKGRPYGR